MGFLAGFTQGLGSYAQDMSKKMLDLRTAGATHMADLYTKLAENYKTNPTLMGEYLKRSQAFTRLATNPFDMAAHKETQAYADPGEPIRNFLNTNINDQHTRLTGQPADKSFLIGGKLPTVGASGVSQGPISSAISQAPQPQNLPQPGSQPAAPPSQFGPDAQGPPQFHQTPWGTQEQNPDYEVFQRGRDAYTQATAANEARLHFIKSMGLGQGSSNYGPPTSTLNRVLQTDANYRDAGITSHPWVEPKTVTLSDAGGPPTTYWEHKGKFYDMGAGEPVQLKGPTVQTTLFRQPTETSVSSTTSKDPNTLDVTKTETRRTGGVPAAPGAVVHHGVKGVLADANRLAGNADAASTTEGGPNKAEQLTTATDKTQLKKRNSARTALNLMSNLDDTLRANKDLVGAAAGRVYVALNKVGSGSAIDWVRSLGIFKDENVSAEVADQRINQMINAAHMASKDPSAPENVRKGAEVLAEIITQMRALNGLELVTMSGSGNGITRLYMMLKDVMLNPNQTYDLLYGHERGLASLFASTDDSYNSGLGKGWKDIEPRWQGMYEKFGAGKYFNGYAPAATAPPSTSYKFYAKNPQGHRIGSNDQQKWFDITTGQPVQ